MADLRLEDFLIFSMISLDGTGAGLAGATAAIAEVEGTEGVIGAVNKGK